VKQPKNTLEVFYNNGDVEVWVHLLEGEDGPLYVPIAVGATETGANRNAAHRLRQLAAYAESKV